MTVTVLCPHCGVECAVPAAALDAEGTCPVCGGRFLPRTARRPAPLPPPPPAAPASPAPAPPTRRRSPMAWPAPPPRPTPDPDPDPDFDPEADDEPAPVESHEDGRQWARAAGAVLFVMWIVCGLSGAAVPRFTLAILILPDKSGRVPEDLAAVAKVISWATVLATVVGVYGAVCAFRRRQHGWAMASAVLLPIMHLGCCFTWLIAVWAVAMLTRPAVRAVFNETEGKPGG